MVLVKANAESEAGTLPPEEMLIEMGKFNEELVKAGVMLAGEGLQPSSKGARIAFGSTGKTKVIDGPFAETKELIAGFWIVQAKSMQEVIERFSHAPFRGGEIEIRRVHESADFEPVIKTDDGRALLTWEDEQRKKQGMTER
jgi:hypothetical protein